MQPAIASTTIREEPSYWLASVRSVDTWFGHSTIGHKSTPCYTRIANDQSSPVDTHDEDRWLVLESALTDPHLEMTFGLRPLLISPSCVLRHLDRFHLSVLGPRSSFLSLFARLLCVRFSSSNRRRGTDGEADDHDHGDSRLILIQHRDPVSARDTIVQCNT